MLLSWEWWSSCGSVSTEKSGGPKSGVWSGGAGKGGVSRSGKESLAGSVSSACLLLSRCYVNPMTCQHKPFLSNNGQVSAAWDSCMGPGLNTTIDAGEATTPHRVLIDGLIQGQDRPFSTAVHSVYPQFFTPRVRMCVVQRRRSTTAAASRATTTRWRMAPCCHPRGGASRMTATSPPGAWSWRRPARSRRPPSPTARSGTCAGVSSPMRQQLKQAQAHNLLFWGTRRACVCVAKQTLMRMPAVNAGSPHDRINRALGHREGSLKPQ